MNDENRDKDKDEIDDKEWSSMLSDWQNQPTRAIDATALLRRIKRRSWVIWLTSTCDVTGVAAGWIAGFWLLFTGERFNLALLLLLVSVWGSVMVYIELGMRKGTWRLTSEGNASILEFSIKRCEVAIKIGKFFTPAVISFVAVVLVWQSVVYWLSAKNYWQFLAGGVAWGGLVIVASKIFVARKQKELKKLKEMR